MVECCEMVTDSAWNEQYTIVYNCIIIYVYIVSDIVNKM